MYVSENKIRPTDLTKFSRKSLQANLEVVS
jgi:hypothetical protein